VTATSLPHTHRPLFGAIEGGGSKFLCAIGRGPEELVELTRIDTTTPDETLARVADFFAPKKKTLSALGMGCFGPLELNPSSEDHGSLLKTPKPGWSHTQLRQRLQTALDLPVAIDTDVNAAALAEQRWGAAREADPIAYVTVGTGVGVGVVVQGHPLHGLMHPELGHMPAHDPTFAGVCPFHGSCVEGLVSAPALKARTGTSPDQLPDDHPVWESMTKVLATLLQTIVLAYSPRKIVLGGGVFQRVSLLPRLHAQVLQNLNGYVPREELTQAQIAKYVVPAQLGTLAGLAGAFVLAEGAC
jgi:fructokinase